MTTQEVADRLVSLCRQRQFEQACVELYSPDIISIEAEGVPNRVVKGMQAVAEKGKKFESRVEQFHSCEVSDPIVADDFFTCGLYMNIKFHDVPVAIDMNEICVYRVKDGKIVQEEFYYTPMPQMEMV
ncbi:MAG: SnoaL-like domain-containing protein [Bacteroidota bacterium]